MEETMKWDYPCLKCKFFPCNDTMKPYCLILYADQDELFREIVRKYKLSKAEATVLITMFKGNGVCVNYEPIGEPVLNEKVEKALRELKRRWV